MRLQICSLPLLAWACLMQSAFLSAQETTQSDEVVRSRLFGEHILSSNVASIRKDAAELPPDQRYEFLRTVVLPTPQHPLFRLQGDFTPTNPVPPVAGTEATDEIRIERARQTGQRMVATGGLVVSPAFDLIRLASELKKLPELKAEVENITAIVEVQERAQIALLVLIALEQHDTEAAFKGLEELDRRLMQQTFPSLADRWPETLVAYRVVDEADYREPALALIRRLLEGQARAGKDSGPEPWNRLISALFGRIRHRSNVESGRIDAPFPQLNQWIPVTFGDSSTRARGYPCTQWQLDAGTVMKLASNYNECLFYHIPLTGDYTVDFDIGAFNYHDTAAVLAGHQYDLQWGLKQLDVRGTRERLQVITIDPPLSKIDEWKRVQMVVKGNTASIRINGSEVLQDQMQPLSFPWVGIRTPFYSYGAMKNFQVSGSPDIPDLIPLLADPELPGWKPYMRDVMDAIPFDWKFSPDLGESGGLVGRHKVEIQGMQQESLVQYMRPMAEDGVIRYEFFYELGQIHVHPCLDRKAFLISPEGVHVHWVGDDLWDQSGLDPRNQHAEGTQLAAGELRLQSGWNSMQFQLSDDEVTLALNGTDIYKGPIEITNDRLFGFFHYADQTEVRVRNVEWRGDWPKKLPPLELQVLHDERLVRLEASRPTNAEFEFDFRTGDWKEKFSYQTHITGGHIESGPRGLQMFQPGSQSFQDTWLLPLVTVAGDFDIVAEFEDLQIRGGSNCGGGLYLTAIAEDQFTPHCKTHWGVTRRPNEREFWHLTAEIDTFHPQVKIRYEGEIAEDARAGKLKLSRRGKRVTFLIAEGNSDAYRVIYEDDISDRPLRTEGIRIGTGLWCDGSDLPEMEVTWTKCSIHADQIKERVDFRNRHRLADEEFRDKVLANRPLKSFLSERPPLPLVLHEDFKTSVPNERVAVVGAAWERNVKLTPGGLSMTRNGGGGYPKFWIVPQLQLDGDFDIIAAYENLQFETQPGAAAGIHLYVGLDDEWNTEYRLFRKLDTSSRGNSQFIEAFVFEHIDGETPQDYPSKLPAQSSAGQLRFLRRGEWLLYLFADGNLSKPNWQLISAQKAGTAVTRLNALRLDIEHHGSGQTSVVWKDLSIRAEKAFGPAVEQQLAIAELDQQHDQLSAHFELDFAKTDPLEKSFQRWSGGSGKQEQSTNGLNLAANGSSGWTALGYRGDYQLEGDFDLALEFSDLKFDLPSSGDSTVGLEILFPGQRYQAVQAQFHVTPGNVKGGWVVTALQRPDGSIHYEELQSLTAKEASLLRIARRGDVAYLIFQETPENPVRILQRIQLQDSPPSTQRIQMLVHAGGEGKTTSVTFRKLRMSAERIVAPEKIPIPARGFNFF